MPTNFELVWNPKLPQLLVGDRTSLRLLNVDTGTMVEVGPKVAGGHSWVAWHPEGRLLAVGGEMDCKIYLWDVPAGRLVMPLEDHKSRGVVMRFNHAGDRLLSTDWTGAGHLWDTRSGRLLLTRPGFWVNLHFSPDDRLVGTGSGGTPYLYHLRRGEEMRTMVHRNKTGQSTPFDFHGTPGLGPEGRLFAIGSGDGVALVDLARGEEAALLPLPGNLPLRFDAEGALWTHGRHGLLRWPVTVDPKTGQRRYGPPRGGVLGRTHSEPHGSSTDARVVAIPDYNRGALVLHRDSMRLLRLSPQDDVRFCAVSPDGRWVATGSHGLRAGAGAKVWGAKDGRHEKDLPVGDHCRVQFSPDGKWLLTTSGGPRLWAVGSWEEGPKLGGTSLNGSGAFSGDGKLLALGDEAFGVVRLVVTDTAKEIARLTAPEQARLLPCCFTPDGTQLITFGVETTTLHIFDLRAIRAGLAELDLDWNALPLPAASAPPAAPLSIHFELGDVLQLPKADALVGQAFQHVLNKEHAKALAALRQAVEVAPSHARAHRDLASVLLNGPKELRDPEQALPQARKAVELEPDQYLFLNTLGLALYRTGQFAEAVPVLERSLGAGKGQTDAFQLFVLAMCHHRRGDAARARHCLEDGRRWFQTHKDKLPAGWVEELSAFQAEAEAVLAERPVQP
jgi:WD40 repeat protein